jgi:hypothetical protein
MKRLIIVILVLMIMLQAGVYAQNTKSAVQKTDKTPVNASTGTNTAEDNLAELNKCIKNISAVQTFIEFYFMKIGSYPSSLDSLEKALNNDEGKSPKERITLPKDLSTGRDFVYDLNNNGTSYVLKAADPSKYKMKSLEVSQVNWGWLAIAAGEQRKQFIYQMCVNQMKELATLIEFWSKDNKNLYPEELKQLMPKYLEGVPLCPGCNKPYVYKKLTDGYQLSCPDPACHGLKLLKWDSNQGLIQE